MYTGSSCVEPRKVLILLIDLLLECSLPVHNLPAASCKHSCTVIMYIMHNNVTFLSHLFHFVTMKRYFEVNML